MSEAVEKTEVGKLAGIEEKDNGWFELKISVENLQYPVKLATKRSSLVDDARALRGEVCTWTFKEKESDRINENSGKPYMNRYFEKVEAGGVARSSSNGRGPAGGKEDVDWDGKERRDYRSRAWAQTISAFAHTVRVDEEPTAVFDRLRPFQERVYLDIVQELATVPDAEQKIDEPPPPTDDDIPF